MAIVTNALLVALRTQLSTTFRTSYAAMDAGSFWRNVAMLAPSTSASNTYDWLGEFPVLAEWIGDRVIKDLKENGYQISNKLFESTVGVKRTALEDDTAGTYGTIVSSMGQEAARHPDRLIAALLGLGETALCYDGQPFFDVDHPVYANNDGTGTAATVSNLTAGAGPAWYLMDCSSAAKPLIFQERTKPEFDSLTDAGTSESVFMRDQYLYGTRYRCNAGFGFWQKAHKSRAALTGDTFDTVFAQMQSLKGDGGRPLGVTPTHILVPPTLRSSANAVVKAALKAGGETNTNLGAVEVIVTPWLA